MTRASQQEIHGRRAGGRPAVRCNLVLVSRPRVNRRSDFEWIGAWIRQFAPDVHPVVVEDGRRYLPRAMTLWTRPTMVFSPVGLNRLRFLRGAVFQGQPLAKSQEYAALEKAGLPVPRWAVVTPERTPDLSDFGPYVILKPDLGMRGADVRIIRTSRVRWREPRTTLARLSSQRNRDLVAQEFIYTGPWPVSYRVTTLFGRVLFSTRTEAARDRRPLSGRYAFADEKGGGMSIVSSGKGCVFTLNDDPEIIRLGEEAHRAFPDIPLLGVDILREEPGGKLYVIEVNAGGSVWHFSSPTGLKVQQDFGFNLESQFDGLRRAASILAEQARACAR